MRLSARRVAVTLVPLLTLGLLPAGPLLTGAAADVRPEIGRPAAVVGVQHLASGEALPLPVELGPAASPVEDPTDDRALLVAIERSLPVTAHAGGGRTVGTMPATSRYYGEPIVAWVQRVSRDGRAGLVSVPYVAGAPSGWIRLRGLGTSATAYAVEVDLSRHELVVLRGDEIVLRAAAATGAPSTPTPTGTYFVTDRVPLPGGGAFGTYAFGISGIQPRLPIGWTGGDQLAIHGTDDPSSIGREASAGCLRVSERVLERLKPLLRLGTPVVISR